MVASARMPLTKARMSLTKSYTLRNLVTMTKTILQASLLIKVFKISYSHIRFLNFWDYWRLLSALIFGCADSQFPKQKCICLWPCVVDFQPCGARFFVVLTVLGLPSARRLWEPQHVCKDFAVHSCRGCWVWTQLLSTGIFLITSKN